jgi:hypothetical protein
MEKRNRHGQLWSKEDEKAQLIGFVQAEDLEEAAKQAALFRENEVDILVYDEEELDEIFEEGDIVLVLKDGKVTTK